jgi:hypothetical protein
MHLTEGYRFVMEVPVDSTLAELASFILGMVNFDTEHLDEFYLANSKRGKKTWFTTDGEWYKDDSAVEDICLSKIFPLPKPKKLFYLYDFGDSWCFEITKKGKEKLANPDVEYPCIVEEEGLKPEQYGREQDDLDAGD